MAAPSHEPHLDPLPVPTAGWLITSPEYHMKRLLAAGEPRIFQLARCFRAGEDGPHHRSQFTMVEWYRTGVGYDRIMSDVEGLVAHASTALHGAASSRRTPWPRLTVDEAFRRFAEVDLAAAAGDVDQLRQQAEHTGFRSLDDGDDWDIAFHKLLVERVEPALAQWDTGVHLREYPAAFAALARLHPERRNVALRFESYIGGLELANGFDELTDARLQRQRFYDERRQRRARGGRPLPLDEEFLRDLEDMPPASGVALGLERLLMTVTGATCIDDVVTF